MINRGGLNCMCEYYSVSMNLLRKIASAIAMIIAYCTYI
jgi:hypothetical protein